MQQKIDDTEVLYNEVFDIDDGLAEVFDSLAINAASIAKIEPLVAEIRGLHEI